MGLSRIQILQLENEATYGTPPAMDGTNAVIAFDVAEPTVDGEPYSRAVMTSLARPMRGQAHGRRKMAFAWSQELRGHPDDYTANTKFPQPHWGLQSSSLVGSWLANVWTYQMPVRGGYGTTAPPSLAGYLNHDGLAFTMKGARGNAVFNLREGLPALVRFAMTSLFTKPAVVALPTEDYATGTAGIEDLTPPLVENIGLYPLGALPLQGEYGHIRGLTIDLRNQVESRESPNCGAGFEGVGEISLAGHGTKDDPGIGVTFDVEQPLTAAGLTRSAWWDAWDAQTLMRAGAGVSLVATVGTSAGNTFVFTFGGLLIRNITRIQLGERWGDRVECRALGTAASTTEDDLIITAT